MSKYHDPADDFDGIKEDDNPLPRWWVFTFIGTIIFAVIYYAYYQLGSGPNLMDEYNIALEKQKAAAEAAKPSDGQTAEMYAAALQDSKSLEAGKTIFMSKCAACHNQKGEGLIGPNLTDKHWIHGKGLLEDIAKVVIEGVPEKGMIPWGGQLSQVEIVNVVAFVKSLEGTMVPGKPPEGSSVD